MRKHSERAGCLGLFLKLLRISPDFQSGRRQPDFPYRLRENFLSPAELSFYRVLVQSVGESFSINNKVRLWDILTVPKHEGSRSYENRISSKHIDFLLCDPTTMQPVLAIELDDASHARKDRQERDAFLDQALAAAGLAILHIRAARAYSVAEVQQQINGVISATTTISSHQPLLKSVSNEPSCPKCHAVMVQRKAAKGVHAGKRFWACTNYPRCREIIGID